MVKETRKKSDSGDKDAPKKLVATKRIGASVESENVVEKSGKKNIHKKVLYLEIDDEITSIYDKLKQLKVKNVYLVVPKRAILFQSIVNLKILKRKAEDLEKNIYIITNDPNGLQLAKQIGLMVYDKLENQEHPSLVSGKFLEDQQDITPLKASVNTVEDDTPIRQTERKFSISDLVKSTKRKGFALFKRGGGSAAPGGQSPAPTVATSPEPKKIVDKKKLVVVAPNRQALASLVVVSVIILLLISYIALPGATIKITPKSSILPADQNVTLADAEIYRAELETHPPNLIPSYMVSTTIKRPLSYMSTGAQSDGFNAKGNITVINTSNQNWQLIPKTRFQTDSGLVFKSLGYATIPPQKGDTPGTAQITVEADTLDALGNPIGEKGNIGPTRFFLPGLSPDSQKKLYAESKENMTGGQTKVTKYIVKEDIEAAKAKLAQDLKNSAQAELQALVTKKNQSQKLDLVLLVGPNAIQLGEPRITVPDNLENQRLDKFDLQGEMDVTGIAYNHDELIAILRGKLKQNQNPQKKLVYIDEESLTYNIDPTNSTLPKRVTIAASIKGIEEYELDPEKPNGESLIKKLKQLTTGKSVEDARTYILTQPEVDKVTIDRWPAWSPSMPNVPDNIKIEILEAALPQNQNN